MKRTHQFLAFAAFALLGTAAFGQAPGAVTPSQGAGAPTVVTPAPGAGTENRGEAITGRTVTGSNSGVTDAPKIETARPVLPPTTVPSRVAPLPPAATPIPRATVPGALATPVPKSDRPGGLDVGVPDAATGGKVLDITKQSPVPPPVTTPGTGTTGGVTTK